MWRKEDSKPQGIPQAPSVPTTGFPHASTNSAPGGTSIGSSSVPAALPVSPRATACISQGIKIKGEITGKEDLFLDGSVEGKLEFHGATVTVGPNGKVTADITAKEVVVRGQVDGRIDGTERVQLWNSGRVVGEVKTERLAIEDGAVLRGKVEAGKVRNRAIENKQKSPFADAGKSADTGAAASSHSAVI